MTSAHKKVSKLIPPRTDINQDDRTRIVAEVIADEEAIKLDREKRVAIAKLRASAAQTEKTRTDNIAVYEHPSRIEFKKKIREERLDEAADKIASSKSPVVVVGSIDGKTPIVGTTSKEVTKLLASLNVNLNVQLTKTDTHNLLATLLTCNEAQLDALENNKKIPLAIKAVISRIKKDAAAGNIETIERLWNRIFGPTMLQVDMPKGYQGIIPNVPVSREAYVLIRETLIGHE